MIQFIKIACMGLIFADVFFPFNTASASNTDSFLLHEQMEPFFMNMNAPSPSRPAPPDVPPVEYKGVRYQEDPESIKHGGAQHCGYLVAIDPKTNVRLWMLKVYDVPLRAPGEPTGGGSVNFGSLSVGPAADELTIETEFGVRYIVDLNTRTSKLVFTPVSNRKKSDLLDVPDFPPMPINPPR